MTLELHYGEEKITSTYLDRAEILALEDRDVGDLQPDLLYRLRFEEHFGEEGFPEIISGKENIGLVINDRDRPTPSYIAVEHMLGFRGFNDKVGRVHIATGSHSGQTDEDLRILLRGAYEIFRDRVHIHSARDRDSHIPYGRTSRGTDLLFDRELEDHDLLVLINSVEPHYFAGFTGGRKSIIPGMAHFDTIEKNHSHALSEGSKTLGLAGNPVHEDMVEAAHIYIDSRDHISIQMVQGPGKVLTDVKFGDLFDSFDRAVSSSLGRFCIPVQGEFDIVVSVAASPMDRTLYQAQKAIENGKIVLRDGGVMILVAACSDGIGQSAFWDLLTMYRDPESILRTIDNCYVLGYHKAAKIVQLTRRAHLFTVSKIGPEELEKGFIKGYSDLDSSMKDAIKITGENPRVLVIPEGTVTVPHRHDPC